MQQVFLKPGEFHVATMPSVVSTVLGSCVAICLHGRRRQMGALCHAIFPGYPGKDEQRPAAAFLEYVLPVMLAGLRDAGMSAPELRARIFGGADVIALEGCFLPGGATVGRQNIDAARRILASNAITVIGEETGGVEGYRITYNSVTGGVTVARFATSAARGGAHG